jgi:hypothetical protein
MDAAAKIERMSVLLTKVFFLVLVLLIYRLWSSVGENLKPVSFGSVSHNPQAAMLAGFSLMMIGPSFFFRWIYGRSRAGAPPVANANRAFVGHLISLAIGESIALAGLKLGIDLQNFYVAMPFFALAAALYVVHWPTRK